MNYELNQFDWKTVYKLSAWINSMLSSVHFVRYAAKFSFIIAAQIRVLLIAMFGRNGQKQHGIRECK